MFLKLTSLCVKKKSFSTFYELNTNSWPMKNLNICELKLYFHIQQFICQRYAEEQCWKIYYIGTEIYSFCFCSIFVEINFFVTNFLLRANSKHESSFLYALLYSPFETSSYIFKVNSSDLSPCIIYRSGYSDIRYFDTLPENTLSENSVLYFPKLKMSP